jgi:4-hydroxybenzoate polyprenyltransferase
MEIASLQPATVTFRRWLDYGSLKFEVDRALRQVIENVQMLLRGEQMQTGEAQRVIPIQLATGENPSAIAKLRLFAADIKVSHTIFALPWAILSMFLAADGWPRGGQVGLILACMVTARTVAMAANRLLDAPLDAVNPRTARRAIPSGALSARFVLIILIACAAGFILATAGFAWLYENIWPLVFSVPVLLFLSAYPLLKRFTGLCHYYLGAALALAPVGAWVAISGTIDWPPVVMAAAVLAWTAGFDIIYACQDFVSDRATGVFSIPARVGIAGGLLIARATHIICLALLIFLGLITPQFGILYLIGVALAALLLVIEHAIVRPDDLSKISLAFFTMNGIISIALGTLGICDIFF